MKKTPDLTIASSSAAPRQAARQNRGFAPDGGRGRGRFAARRAHAVVDCEWLLPDPRVWRSQFPRIWQRFLLDRFGDPHVIADVMGVELQTARNWLGGLHRPSGDVAAAAMLHWRRDLIAAALKVAG